MNWIIRVVHNDTAHVVFQTEEFSLSLLSREYDVAGKGRSVWSFWNIYVWGTGHRINIIIDYLWCPISSYKSYRDAYMLMLVSKACRCAHFITFINTHMHVRAHTHTHLHAHTCMLLYMLCYMLYYGPNASWLTSFMSHYIVMHVTVQVHFSLLSSRARPQ